MKYLSPYLFMNGNCREVVEFYKSVLGGELFIQTVGESPIANEMPDMKDKIIHAALSKGDKILFMASDMIDGSTATHGNTVDLCLVCESKEELTEIMNKLSEGGKMTMPLKDEFFGTFCAFTDRYGFNWMLQYSEDQK